MSGLHEERREGPREEPEYDGAPLWFQRFIEKRYEPDQHHARTWRSNHDRQHSDDASERIQRRAELDSVLKAHRDLIDDLNSKLRPYQTLRIQARPFVAMLKWVSIPALGAIGMVLGPKVALTLSKLGKALFG